MRSGVTTKTSRQANTSQKSLCPDPNNFLVPMDPVPTSTRLKPSWKTLKEVLDRSRLVSDWQWRYQRLKSARLQDFLALSHDCLYCTGPDWVESGGYLKYTEFRRLCHYVSSVAFMFLSSNLKTKTYEARRCAGRIRLARGQEFKGPVIGAAGAAGLNWPWLCHWRHWLCCNSEKNLAMAADQWNALHRRSTCRKGRWGLA